MGNGVAVQMTEDRIARVQTIVRGADWSACPVPKQGEVQEFLVDGMTHLIRQGSNGNGHRPFWQEWAIRAPYAAAAVIVVALYFYFASGGKIPLPQIPTGATAAVQP